MFACFSFKVFRSVTNALRLSRDFSSVRSARSQGKTFFKKYMTKVILLSAFVSLMVGGGYIAVPSCQAHDLFTKAYLIPSLDPSCMQIHWQTDTHLHGGWVKWGYSAGELHNIATAYQEHQNIKDFAYPLRSAEDFIRWDAWICAKPGQRIFYKAFAAEESDDSDNDAVFTMEGDFVLPLSPSAKHVTFYGYGDTRECGDDFQNVSEALLNEVTSDPDNHQTFLLHCGDVIYNGGATTILYSDNKWMHYFKNYHEARALLARVPVFIAMGNHDFNWENNDNDPKFFYIDFPYYQYIQSVGLIPGIDEDGHLYPNSEIINDAYYSFDYGPVHVAVLNAYTHGELDHLGSCHIGSKLMAGYSQYNWLKNDLAATDKLWKIVQIHVSPFSCDCGWHNDTENYHVRKDLEALFQSTGVDLMVSSHDHYYVRKMVGDPKAGERQIPHLVLGGGGAKLYCHEDCGGCFFHYARFDVNTNKLVVRVYKVLDDAKTELADSVTLWHTVHASTEASFEASATSTDYRTPVRFTCTTDGAHTEHKWDFGDGTTSTEANPLRTFPKPTEPSGIHTYTVKLTVDDGYGHMYETEKDVKVYIKGRLQPIEHGISGCSHSNPCAYFLRPQGEPLDEIHDFLRIMGCDEGPIFTIAPGDYTLTVRAPAYQGYQGGEVDVNVSPGAWAEADVYFVPESHPPATVVIDSVPTGANVTVKVTDNGDPLTGTTPFYCNLCCPGTNIFGNDCTFDYVVEKDGVKVQGTNGICTDMNCKNTVECDGLRRIYVDVRPPPFELSVSDPLIVREPSDQRVVLNGRAQLRVSPRSRETLTYRWYEGESGDTSQPIYRATGPVFITPPLKEQTNYWVRVHAGQTYRDSRTASVEVVGEGPELIASEPFHVCPGSVVRLNGSGFYPTDIQENRVFFGEREAKVQSVDAAGCDVEVPRQLADKEVVDVQIKVNGVWGNGIQSKAVIDWKCKMIREMETGE